MLVWAIGAYAIVSGLLRRVIAIRLRHLAQREHSYLEGEVVPAL
ncbi:MAG: hypothetical protein Q8O67_32590 [Deltaproteobacteria bacterium]|nr:hypothetical protein [Deltaproteobacteria bacterium]